jgi:putative tRNA adenosine deaminase-associated protein
MDDEVAIDFAFAAWREEGRWSVASLPPRAAETLGGFVAALRQLAGEGGVLGFIGVEEEFFIAVRIPPDGIARILLSDVNAAYDFDLAEEALDLLDIELAEDDEEYDEYEPVGDLAFAADFGLEADDVEVLCLNGDLFPDEQVTSMAKRLGFADFLSTVISSPRR